MHKLIKKRQEKMNQGNKQINREIRGYFSTFITEYTIFE